MITLKRIAIGLWLAATIAALLLSLTALNRAAEPGPRGPRGHVGSEGSPGPAGPGAQVDEVRVEAIEASLSDAEDTIECLNGNVDRLADWATSLTLRPTSFGPYLYICS